MVPEAAGSRSRSQEGVNICDLISDLLAFGSPLSYEAYPGVYLEVW
jgi:hypothetical protein